MIFVFVLWFMISYTNFPISSFKIATVDGKAPF